jgi:GNAT superfamily N-acetyltransferase
MRATDTDRVAELATQLGYPSTSDDIAARFKELEARPAEHAILVATDAADTPIAWIHVARIRSLVESEVAMIGGLVVGEGSRSSGVGAALVAAAEAWARERGARTMSVRSRTERERAHRFYEREGYVQIKLSHVFHKPLV